MPSGLTYTHISLRDKGRFELLLLIRQLRLISPVYDRKGKTRQEDN